MIVYVIVALALILGLALMWANGVDKMKENHPDYKGEDLFDEEL